MDSLRTVGAQIYVAVVLAGAAAMMTLPRDAGAHYRELGWFVLRAFALDAEVGPLAADATEELLLGP